MQHQLRVSQLLPKCYSIIQDYEGPQSVGPYSDFTNYDACFWCF